MKTQIVREGTWEIVVVQHLVPVEAWPDPRDRYRFAEAVSASWRGKIFQFEVSRHGSRRTIYGVHTDEAFRNQGYAEYYLRQYIRQNPGCTFELWVWEDNHTARRLYERIGFRVTHQSTPPGKIKLFMEYTP